MSQDSNYDVFLSHSSIDIPVVRELAERLKADGVRVWLDEWIIKPGDAIGVKINEGLEKSRVLVLAISANASESDWATFEHQAILFNDPTNKNRRFIPLRLDDSEIPFGIRQFAYIDWRSRDDEQYQRLLSAVKIEQAELLESQSEEAIETDDVKILEGHSASVEGVAISTDSKLIISGSVDKTIRIWDTASGNCLKVLEGHSAPVEEVAISTDSKLIISGSEDKTIRIWDTASGNCLKVLEGHSDQVKGVAISADSKLIVSGSSDKSIRIWETANGNCLKVLEGHSDSVYGVAISADSKLIVSGSSDESIRIWETANGNCLKVLKGHSDSVWGLALSTDSKLIISGSYDKTIRIWDTASGNCLKVLEGHSDSVWGVVFSTDSKLIISGSVDKTIRIWDTASGNCLKVLEGHSDSVWYVAISADDKLIISGSRDKTIRIWRPELLDAFLIYIIKTSDEDGDEEYDEPYENYILKTITIEDDEDVDEEDDEPYEFYTNAKVLLVGDSGVGKSGLAYRLTQNKFVETVSTDGVWATQLKLPHSSNTADTEREIWLWDFAGQSDYRLIHQLFMDETALAVLVFNPQADDPFDGLGQWDRDLQKAARRPFNKLLVAGRCDRGSLTVSEKSLADFKDEREFAHYLETSALTGAGCDELREAIIKHIDWDEIPHRTSPRIFKLLKEEIIKLKDEGRVLLRLSELKQNLEIRLLNERFTVEELKTVVGLLAGSGVVWELEFGDFVLLQPEKINSYAAAVVRSVRAHVDEIGCIAEEKVLSGELDYQDMKRLPKNEEEVVLRAMYQTFIGHGLCLREKTDEGVLLVFPSYFRRERPMIDEHPAALVTYQFSGMLDEIYATLVVKLHHTSAFDKDQLWRYAADFKTMAGKRVGLKMTRKPEGAAEITVYFEKEIPDETKAVFIRYVQDHLKSKDENVVRIRHYICPHCAEPFENERAIRIRLGRNLKDITCPVCDEKFDIWDLIEEKFHSSPFQQLVRQMDEEAQIAIGNQTNDVVLVNHAYAIAKEAGQIFYQTPNSDCGIDGEIEFKDYEGKASGKRVYLQLKSGDSYLRTGKGDDREIFEIDKQHAGHWLKHNYEVMHVIRTSNGEIRWMNATEYLKAHGKETRRIIFDGEPFTALNLVRLRDRLLLQK
jgi:small GTP-binding protein